MAKKQNYVMHFAGSRYLLGKLDAEQIMTIKQLVQAVTWKPVFQDITEDNRFVTVEGDKEIGPVMILDRRRIFFEQY